MGPVHLSLAKGKPFKCPWLGCPNSFTRESNCHRHLQLHVPPRFRCDQCGKFLSRPDSLRRHQILMACGKRSRFVRRRGKRDSSGRMGKNSVWPPAETQRTQERAESEIRSPQSQERHGMPTSG
ncbi:unnamed protein product [Mycena citricolor]|uniref:C2H2-type domain-containing protein n=1 Tax=Mycena citricolor TaxID=2018698 RepID=A0AAD2H2D5_9AGAR|nr:unnamed protein product [Mycena citricolor]